MRNCSTFVSWINSHSKLLHMTNLQCKRSFHDLRRFDVIYALLCGAKMNSTFLSMEQEGQIWCMVVGWWCVRDVSKKYCHHKNIRSSDKLFRYGDFLSEKNIVGPQEAQDPRFWLPWTMTHYILGSICFRTPTPPIWLETQKCAILSTFSESGGKNHLYVEVRREKFYIGNLSLLFFMAFYICWDYVISFPQHFPMRKFSPSPSTSPSPESGGLFEIWLRNGN